MDTNPYSPPSNLEKPPEALTTRESAGRHVRLAISILLVPALYNLIAFAFCASLASQSHSDAAFVSDC